MKEVEQRFSRCRPLTDSVSTIRELERMQILRPYLRLTVSEALKMGPGSLGFNLPSR